MRTILQYVPFRSWFYMFHVAKKDTLSPRGVCSRIPHFGVSSTPTHRQISTHVYVPHIIPFLRCPRHHRGTSITHQPSTQSRHSSNHAIQSKLTLPHRRQHPPANRQPDNQRIQTPPVCGNDVQKYSTIRGHGTTCHYTKKCFAQQRTLTHTCHA